MSSHRQIQLDSYFYLLSESNISQAHYTFQEVGSVSYFYNVTEHKEINPGAHTLKLQWSYLLDNKRYKFKILKMF